MQNVLIDGEVEEGYKYLYLSTNGLKNDGPL
jgi:hypothetical protein